MNYPIRPDENHPAAYGEGVYPRPIPEPPSAPDTLTANLLLWREFFFRVILKHKWLIGSIVLTALLLAVVQTVTTTPLYQAALEIQMDPDFAKVLPHGQVTDSSFMATSAYLETQIKVIESRSLAQRVAQRLDLANNPKFNQRVSGGLVKSYVSGGRLAAYAMMPLNWILLRTKEPEKEAAAGRQEEEDRDPNLKAAQRLWGRIDADVVAKSRLIEISFISPDPGLAADIVNTAAAEFIQLDLENRYETTTGATDFLQAQLQDLKDRVERSEAELIRYAKAHNIVNVDERENMVITKLSDLSRRLTAVEARLAAEKARFSEVESASLENFPQSLRTSEVSQLERRISQLHQNMATLRTRFGPRWPKVIEAEQEMAELHQQLQLQKEAALNQARRDHRTSLEEYQNLRSNLLVQKQAADRLNNSLIDYKILQREAETNRQLYNSLLQRMKEAGLSANLKNSNIRIIDRAAVPRSAFTPQPGLNVALALILGVGLAIGLAALLDVFDTSIRTPDEVERVIGLPSLGIIPSIRELRTSRADKKTAVVAVTGEPRDPALIPFRDMGSRVWEPYRALRTSLLLSHPDNPPAVIMVTSPLEGDGKTTTSVNLGIILAQTGARTLIMDLDMRRPRMAAIFGVSGDIGLSVYLSGNTPDLPRTATAVPDLYLTTAGKQPPNPAELIGSKRLSEAIRSLRTEFDFIVIDSPPVLSCTDAVVLSPRVDGVVLVAQGGETSRNAVKKTASQLSSVGAKILGVLLNNVDLEKPEYSYYYRDYRQHYHYRGQQA